MMRGAVFLISLTLFCQSPDDTDLLGRVRLKVRENLTRLPNYTCMEAIERAARRKPTDKFTISDNIRLEVAYVEGNELFGWPGAAKIEEPDIRKFVRGAIGNGDFAITPRNIFFTPSAKINLAGETDLDGKHAIRFEFSVPRNANVYTIESESGIDYVGLQGSFWVDSGTLDLIRIESGAFDIPSKLGVESSVTTLNYGPVSIGSSTFLLPQHSEFVITLVHGYGNRNRMTFHGCRQFSGVSVLKFEEPTIEPAAVAPPHTVANVNLPGSFEVEMKLLSPIDSSTAAIGDSVRATLAQNIKSGRDIVVPKGAEVSCRIAVLEKGGSYYVLELQATSIDFESRHSDLHGRENKVTMIIFRNGRMVNTNSVSNSSAQIFRTDHLQLSRGTGFILRSRLLKSKDNDSIRP
jgi:hypothetical protein